MGMIRGKSLRDDERETISRLWDLGLCGGCIARIMGRPAHIARAYRGWKRPQRERRYYQGIAIDWKPEELKRLEEILDKKWREKEAV